MSRDWPIYLAPKKPSDENHIYCYIRSICDKQLELSKYFQGRVLANRVWVSNDNKMRPSNLNLHFQIIKLCYKVVSINNFLRQSCSSKCLEGNRENISKSLYIYPMYRPTHLAVTLCSKRCISKTTASICMIQNDTALESLLNGLIGSTFISRPGALSTRRARPTTIVVPLVLLIMKTLKSTTEPTTETADTTLR